MGDYTGHSWLVSVFNNIIMPIAILMRMTYDAYSYYIYYHHRYSTCLTTVLHSIDIHLRL